MLCGLEDLAATGRQDLSLPPHGLGGHRTDSVSPWLEVAALYTVTVVIVSKDLCFTRGTPLCNTTPPMAFPPHIYYVQRPEIAMHLPAQTDHGTVCCSTHGTPAVGAAGPARTTITSRVQRSGSAPRRGLGFLCKAPWGGDDVGFASGVCTYFFWLPADPLGS